MPVSRIGQILETRYCDPGRPGAYRPVTTNLGPAENSRRVEVERPQDRLAPHTARCHYRVDGKERVIQLATQFAPIEVRVSIEDIEPASDHDEDRKRIDPVGQAHKKSVPVDHFPPAARSGAGHPVPDVRRHSSTLQCMVGLIGSVSPSRPIVFRNHARVWLQLADQNQTASRRTPASLA